MALKYVRAHSWFRLNLTVSPNLQLKKRGYFQFSWFQQDDVRLLSICLLCLLTEMDPELFNMRRYRLHMLVSIIGNQLRHSRETFFIFFFSRRWHHVFTVEYRDSDVLLSFCTSLIFLVPYFFLPSLWKQNRFFEWLSTRTSEHRHPITLIDREWGERRPYSAFSLPFYFSSWCKLCLKTLLVRFRSFYRSYSFFVSFSIRNLSLNCLLSWYRRCFVRW